MRAYGLSFQLVQSSTSLLFEFAHVEVRTWFVSYPFYKQSPVCDSFVAYILLATILNVLTTYMHLITSRTLFTADSDPDRVVAGAGEAVKRRLMGRYFKSSAGLPGDAACSDGYTIVRIALTLSLLPNVLELSLK